LFELRIAEAITEEAVLSQDLIQEGFLHAFKAGELLQEVKSMLSSERDLEQWLEQNCSKVEKQVAFNCLKLFNGETVSVQATKKEERTTKEKEVE
jgi:ribosomal protein S13